MKGEHYPEIRCIVTEDEVWEIYKTTTDCNLVKKLKAQAKYMVAEYEKMHKCTATKQEILLITERVIDQYDREEASL